MNLPPHNVQFGKVFSLTSGGKYKIIKSAGSTTKDKVLEKAAPD